VPVVAFCSPKRPVKAEEWKRERHKKPKLQDRWYLVLPVIDDEVLVALRTFMLRAVDEACELATKRGLGRLEPGQKPIGLVEGVLSVGGKGFLAVCCLLDRAKRPIGVCACSPIVEVDADTWAEDMDRTERLIFRVLFEEPLDIVKLRNDLVSVFDMFREFLGQPCPYIV